MEQETDAARLEQLVREAKEQPAQRAALLEALPGAKVAVLFDRGLEDGRFSPQARPLVLNDANGQPMIAAFSSVEMGKPWAQREPKFGFALYTRFDWLVRIAPDGVGIALNPGYRYDCAIGVQEVQAMKQALGQAPATS